MRDLASTDKLLVTAVPESYVSAHQVPTQPAEAPVPGLKGLLRVAGLMLGLDSPGQQV